MYFKKKNIRSKWVGRFISYLFLFMMLITAFLPCKQALADSEFEIIDGALMRYTGNGGDVIIPNTVKIINGYVFCNKTNITSIEIPKSVVEIHENAFDGCSGLTKITIPSSVRSIGNFAFINCSKLESITIPKSVTSIGGLAFVKTPWLEAKKKSSKMVVVNNILIDGQLCKGNVVISNKVKVIGASAFWNNSNITKITLSKSVKTIEAAAFADCNSLRKIEMPNSVTSIVNGAFNRCSKLSSIIIPKSVTRIDGNVFGETPWMKAKLKKSKFVIVNGILIDANQCKGKVTIPNNVKTIGAWAFLGCNVTDVIIPESVTSITEGAFTSCQCLRSITIPKNVKTIEEWAIDDLLKQITIIGAKGSAAETYATKNNINFSNK